MSILLSPFEIILKLLILCSSFKMGSRHIPLHDRFISYGATLVFYTALLPRLARNTPHAHALKEKFDRGELSAEDYETEESMEKNKISNKRSPALHSGSHLKKMKSSRTINTRNKDVEEVE